MPPKKSSARLKSRKKPVTKKGGKKGAKGNQCTDQEICKHLRELNKWLRQVFADDPPSPNTDYQQLRIAVCNLEARVFDGLGSTAKRFPPCGLGGPSGDPAKPPPPPKWT